MLLLIDIGNTNIKIKFEIVTVLETDINMTLTDLVNEIGEFKMLGVTEVEGVVISSVVPELTKLFTQYSKEVLGLEPVVVSNKTSKYEITVEEEIGADILATINAVVGESIIIMLGTATVVTYVKDGLIPGTIIAPGVLTGIKSLIESTAQLNDFEVDVPNSLLGSKTNECLQSGAIYGHAAMIDGLIDRINPTEDVKIVAMGGFSEKIIPFCKYDIKIDNDLLFKGLEKIYEYIINLRK